eukprot:TRINITY_DN14272_c0_g1_i2.p1 TRINITY_DN14272_c0_g1~~TRINITY_DN14272_c0_g1_i2.p1  ORF type:complete len:186 (+),score=20.66 TRINITY_DN14272_c0_g1_i2:24-560(+)
MLLPDLPPEVLQLVLKYVPHEDLCGPVLLACHNFRDAILDDVLWRTMCDDQFHFEHSSKPPRMAYKYFYFELIHGWSWSGFVSPGLSIHNKGYTVTNTATIRSPLIAICGMELTRDRKYFEVKVDRLAEPSPLPILHGHGVEPMNVTPPTMLRIGLVSAKDIDQYQPFRIPLSTSGSI